MHTRALGAKPPRRRPGQTRRRPDRGTRRQRTRWADLRGDRCRGLDRRATAGITLIELLVVLALLAVLAGLALPNLERLTASVTRDTEREHILNQFAELGAAAMLDGLDYVVVGTDALDAAASEALVGRTRYPLDVPDGWEVVVDAPILARANGVCLGGSVTLFHDDLQPRRVDLTAPFCRVDAH